VALTILPRRHSDCQQRSAGGSVLTVNGTRLRQHKDGTGFFLQFTMRRATMVGMAKRRPRITATNPPAATPAPAPPKYASICPGKPPIPAVAASYQLPSDLVDATSRLEADLNLPVWLLLQDAEEDERERGMESFNLLGNMVAGAFFGARHTELPKGQRIALVIDSNGGKARPTYELAMLLRRHCGGFVAVIPRHAKSAATLLTLGADEIIMNDHAELGPLDVQLYDADREETLSGLDEYQALERLQAFALRTVDQMMLMYLRRTKKKIRTLFPVVADFVTKLTQPMFASIDVVRYTQMSRLLKVAEEYGKRLLTKDYPGTADEIAQALVELYPEHGFPIYPDELRTLGLRIAQLTPARRGILEEMTRSLAGLNVIGKIV
jgi:hypothetical protein